MNQKDKKEYNRLIRWKKCLMHSIRKNTPKIVLEMEAELIACELDLQKILNK